MNNLLKKGTAAVAVVALSSSLISTASAASGFLPFAESLANDGIISAKNTEAGYRLNDNVLRQEVVAISVAMKTDLPASYTCQNTFADVSTTTPNTWVCRAAEIAASEGIVTTANSTFRPEADITRSESLAMLLRGAGCEITPHSVSSFGDVSIAWQRNVSETALSKGIISANANFRPNDTASRGETFVMAVNAMNKCDSSSDNTDNSDDNTDDSTNSDIDDLINDLFGTDDDDNTDNSDDNTDDSTDNTDDNTDVVVDGDLTASLSPNTPASQDIPSVAQAVRYTSFDLTAGDADARVDSVTITREGLGSRGDFDKVWLEINGMMISSDRSINSSDMATLTISGGLVVEAGETVTVDVVASMETDGDTGHVNKLVVSEIMLAEGTASGTPIAGNLMRVTAYEVATIEFDATGSDAEYDVGEEDRIIGEFDLEVQGTNDKDVNLKFIRLENNGSADMDSLANIGLYHDGDMVSSSVMIDGDYVTFMMDNGFMIEDGDSRDFEIRADIVSGDDNDTIMFELKDDFDIRAEEKGTSIGANITLDDAELRTYTINAGRVSVTRDITNPSSEDYAKNTSNITALVAKVDLGQDVIADSLTVTLDAPVGATKTTIEKDLKNVKLKVGDTIIDSLDDVELVGGKFVYKFDNSFEMSDNDKIIVMVDIDNNAVTGNKYRFSFTINDFENLEYLDSGDRVDTSDKSGTVTSNFFSIENAEAQLVRNDGYSTETFVAGTQGAKLLSFVANAGSVSGVEVDDLTFTFDLAGLSAAAITAANNKLDYYKAIKADSAVQTSITGTTSPNLQYAIDQIAGYTDADKQQAAAEAVVVAASQACIGTDHLRTTQTNDGTNKYDVPFDISGSNDNIFRKIGFDGSIANNSSNTAPDDVPSQDGSYRNTCVGTLAQVVAAANAVASSYATGSAERGAAQDIANRISDSANTTAAVAVEAGDTRQIALYPDYVANPVPAAVANINAMIAAVSNVNTLPVPTVSAQTVAGVQAEIQAWIDAQQLVYNGLIAGANNDYTKYTNLRLMVGGAQIGTTEDLLSNGTVTFDSLNYEIPRSGQVQFDLYSDIDSTTFGDTQITLTNSVVKDMESDEIMDDIDDNLTDIDTDFGAIGSANIDTGETAILSFVTSGKLNIAIDGNNPKQAVLIGGTNNVEVMRVKLTTQDDNVDVTDLYIANVYDGSTNAPASAVNTSNNRIQTVKLFVDGSQIASKVLSGGKVHFDLGSSNAIRVARDTNKIVSVRVDLNPVTDDSNTGKEFKLSLYGIEAESVATGNILPAGDIVGVDASDDDYTTNPTTSVRGEVYTVAETVPTVVTKTLTGFSVGGLGADGILGAWDHDNDTSTPDVSDDGAPSEEEVYKFSVSADASGDVAVSKFTVDYSTNTIVDTNPVGIYSSDSDGDGIHDAADVDVDGDGTPDNGIDTDGDGIHDAADVDVDGDGTSDNGIDTDGDGIIDSFEPFYTNNGTVKVNVNGTDETILATLSGNEIKIEFENAQVISAGTTKTFEVSATLMGSDSTSVDDYFNARIKDTAQTYAPVNGTTQALALASSGSTFVWSDDSASNNHATVNTSTVSANQWFDSWNVRGLDTTISTLSE